MDVSPENVWGGIRIYETVFHPKNVFKAHRTLIMHQKGTSAIRTFY